MTHTRAQINQLKRWPINIQFCDRGCMVQIGCKSYAFESIEQAMAELVAYTKDPIGVSEKYAPEEFSKELAELRPREPSFSV